MRGRPRLPLALEVCVSSLRTFILITQCSSELGKWRVLLPCVVGLSLAACSGRVGSTGAGGSQGGGAGLTVTLRAVPLSAPSHPNLLPFSTPVFGLSLISALVCSVNLPWDYSLFRA